MTTLPPAQRAPATPREKHLYDVLMTTLARLRSLHASGAGMAEQRREIGRIADTIAAQVDRTGAGE